MVDTSVMADDAEDGVSNKEGVVGDSSVDAAGVGEPDECSAHATTRDLRDAKATLMVKEMMDEHGIHLKLIWVWWRGEGDDGPVPRLDQGFTTKVMVGASTPISVCLHDSSAGL